MNTPKPTPRRPPVEVGIGLTFHEGATCKHHNDPSGKSWPVNLHAAQALRKWELRHDRYTTTVIPDRAEFQRSVDDAYGLGSWISHPGPVKPHEVANFLHHAFMDGHLPGPDSWPSWAEVEFATRCQHNAQIGRLIALGKARIKALGAEALPEGQGADPAFPVDLRVAIDQIADDIETVKAIVSRITRQLSRLNARARLSART